MPREIRKLGSREKGRYNPSFKSILWGVIGLVVSYYMIRGPLSFMGWILFVLSLIMFVLAFWQAIKTKN